MNKRWPVHTHPADRAAALFAALHAIKDAQELVRMAQAPYTLLKVKAARKSLEGAIRHADGRTHGTHTRATTKVRRPRTLWGGYGWRRP